MWDKSEMKCNVAALFKHWLQGSSTKAYFGVVKVADLELTGNDCVSHAPAGCSVLLSQARGRHTITFSTKGHQLLHSNLQIVFLSLSWLTRHAVTARDSTSLFLHLTDSHITVACISIIFDDRGSDCQLLAVSSLGLLKSIDCPSLSPCFYWFSFLISAPHSCYTQLITHHCLSFLLILFICLLVLQVSLGFSERKYESLSRVSREYDALVLHTFCQKKKKLTCILNYSNYSDLNL